MTGIRGILGIFTREVSRGRDDSPLVGEELIAFVRRCTDSNLIDAGFQQAGRAPFWPQDLRHRLFYQSTAEDRPLAARMKAAAERSAPARRAALAHMAVTPDPLLEAILPKRYIGVVHLVHADADQPENSRGFMRLMRLPRSMRMSGTQQVLDTLACWGGDITTASDDTTRAAMLRTHMIRQLGDIIALWLQITCDGAVPAALDAALRTTVQTVADTPEQAQHAFAALRIEIAAAPRLPAGERAACMDVAETVAAVMRALNRLPAEILFACRDDRALIQRGWGDRLEVSNHVVWLDRDTADHLDRLARLIAARLPMDAGLPALAAGEGEQMGGLITTRADMVPGEVCDRGAPHEVLGEMAIFARLIGEAGGNRALRAYWQRCEETGVPSRLGTQMGLVLGDLQQTFEELTRRTRYQNVPDLKRLQDRMMVRAFAPPPAPAAKASPVSDSA